MNPQYSSTYLSTTSTLEREHLRNDSPDQADRQAVGIPDVNDIEYFLSLGGRSVMASVPFRGTRHRGDEWTRGA